MKKNFKKWTALFLSVAMVAVSGVTTNTSFHAAEDTGVQESAADSDTETGTAADATSATSATSATGENGTEATQEVALTQDATDETAEAAGATASSASSEESKTEDNAEDAGTKAVSSESVASSSETVSSSSEKDLTAEEKIQKDLDDSEKTVYSYEDSHISVTATLTDPKAVPDSARFVVTPVTQNSTAYNYDAYMDALNKDADAEADEPVYTDENTLLYDMAFYYDEPQEDGSTKEVEFEPVDGSVQIAAEFKKDQLTKDIAAENDEDVEVTHLPLTDEVKDSVDTTAKATNISTDDVKVENVQSANVSVDGTQTAEFSTDSFSVFAFKNNGEQKNTWAGTTEYSGEQVVNMIRAMDDPTNFAIYANDLFFQQHLEGNIKVANLHITGDAPLNQIDTVQSRNKIKSLVITKTIDKAENYDQTFYFGAFKGNDKIQEFSISIQKENTSGSITLGEDSETVKALSSDNINIYELDKEGGNAVQEGGKVGDYYVQYGDIQIESVKENDKYTNYIGKIQSNISSVSQSFFDQGNKGYKTYIEDFSTGWNGNDLVITSPATDGNPLTVTNYRNIDPKCERIQRKEGISSDVAGTLDYLKSVSSLLANAKNGAKAGTGSLSVINLISTTGNLQGDLDAANFDDVQNGKAISNTINENGYLLINIDLSGKTTYLLNKLTIDGLDPDADNEELARHIIYNFVTKNSDGSYSPYANKVTIDNLAGGTVLLPAGTYQHNGGLRGTVIANQCNFNNGSEIHKDSLTTPTTATVNIKNVHKISVEATKVWLNKDGNVKVPDNASAVLGLYKGNQETPISIITLDGRADQNGEPESWVAEFTNLDPVDDAGNPITYTVKEISCLPSEYHLYQETGDQKKGYVLYNKYAEDGKIRLTAKKDITGREFKSGDSYSFTLAVDTTKNATAPLPKNTTVTIKPTSGSEADVTFDEISYQLADLDNADSKTFYYTIKENTGNLGGITYDTHTEEVAVTVTKSKDGKSLSAVATYDKDGAVFTNTYAASGQTEVKVKKTLNRRFKDGDNWTFTLEGEEGAPVYLDQNASKTITISADKNASGTFGHLNYTLSDLNGAPEKTFKYKITESGDVESVTNAQPVYFNVTVKDKGDGTLSVENGLENETATFANTWSADGKIQLTAKKDITGREFKSGDSYSFTLAVDTEKNERAPLPKNTTVTINPTSGSEANVTFDEIIYKLADLDKADSKTFYYTIKENAGKLAGITYDTHTEEVAVTVTKSKDGKSLSAVATYDESGAVFTNRYNKEKASVYITGKKSLTNGTMKAGQFYFDLYDADGKKVDTATNDESGAFSFARLEFGQEDIGKTFNYTVREQHAGEVIDGIRYADDVIPVRVTVSAGDGGNIIAAASGSADFTNTQLASLTVNKTWNDNDNADGNRPDSVHVSILKDGEVVRQGDLSETTGWSMTFEGLEPGESYTVEESFDSEYYKAEQNDITVDLNGTDNEVTLVNDYIHPTVDIVANKVLVGGKLQSGQFTFQLYRNSDPNTVVATRVNDASGQIVFNDIEYDEAGYTVREVTGTDTHITYDTGAVTYDADGNVTGSHTEFTNTERPIVLRVQKRSKTAPYDPLEGATYGLYQVVEGGNDILVESEVSDENGYMYYSNIQPGVIYYFKEIAAPTGHEVDPYAGQKFQIKYTNDGQIALYDVDGNPTTLGDITSQNSNELLVQHTAAKSTIDTTSALSYSDDTIVAAAKAVNGAFDEGTTLKVTQLTGSAAKSAAAAVEDATGEIKNNVAYYDVQFIDKDGKEVEPKAGDVTVTIQYKDSLSLPEGTDASALKLVHITDGNAVEAVAGSIAAGNGKLLEAKITSDSFSTFGVVEPGKSNTLGNNYLVTAAGVSDQVSELNISKLDTAGKYVKGARLQIIEKATGKVVAEWNTSDGPMSFARWFDGAGTEPMNVDTYYILHEVSAPDGYQLADDIMFIINKYDSSITVYKYDDAGNLVVDQEAVDQWVSDTTLSMVDVPVEYRNKVRYVQKTIHNEKTIQGDNKVVEVTSVRAVKTGDTTPIALFVIMLAAAAVVLMVLAYRKKKQDNQ